MLCVFHFELDPNGLSAEALKKESGFSLEELIPDGVIVTDVVCPPGLKDSVVVPTTKASISLRGNIAVKELNLTDPEKQHYLYVVLVWSVDVADCE